MKSELTIKESAKLIDLGIAPRLASTRKVEYDENFTPCYHAVFTLIDILAILPKNIDGNVIDIISAQVDIEKEDIKDGWLACYVDKESIVTYGKDSIFQAGELIDALYQLLCWVISNGYINLKKK